VPVSDDAVAKLHDALPHLHFHVDEVHVDSKQRGE
jgi:hypothetical protein